jgi:hypothetical protein
LLLTLLLKGQYQLLLLLLLGPGAATLVSGATPAALLESNPAGALAAAGMLPLPLALLLPLPLLLLPHHHQLLLPLPPSDPSQDFPPP